MKKKNTKKRKINIFVLLIIITSVLVLLGGFLTIYSLVNYQNNFTNSAIWMIIFGIIFLFGSVFTGVGVSIEKKK